MTHRRRTDDADQTVLELAEAWADSWLASAGTEPPEDLPHERALFRAIRARRDGTLTGELSAQPAAPERNGFQVRFDGPPGPESGRFVECETLDGKGVSIGRWQQDGEYWLLVVDGRERAAEGSARKAAKSA